MTNHQEKSDKRHLPTAGNVVTHLRLLEAFYTVKQRVQTTDGMFGLYNGQDVSLADNKTSQSEEAMHEKRWAIYVQRAADRFEYWWHNHILPRFVTDDEPVDKQSVGLDVLDLVQEPKKFPGGMLPPVDVLMVWHAYMLNPLAYAEDCVTFRLEKVWSAPVPWAAISTALVSSEYGTFYEPDEKTQLNFEKSGLAWDPEAENQRKLLHCFGCGNLQSHPWVVPITKEVAEGQEPGTGFGEPGFKFECDTCNQVTTHEKLKLKKARDEFEKEVDGSGRAVGSYMFNGTQRHFACELIKLGWGQLVSTGAFESLDNLRGTMDKLQDEANDWEVIKDKFAFVRKKDRYDLYRMLSGYFETHQRVSLDLSAAVVQQDTFVDKMHKIGWVTQPDVDNVIDRAQTRYIRFMTIMGQHPGQVAVPTLDIDLIWHTHQLEPYSYRKYTIARANRFVDHGDKMDEGNLSAAFQWTCKAYEQLYNQVYSECMCWYCEAVRESNKSGIFGQQSQAVASFYRDMKADGNLLAALSDIERTPHISAHNAVKSTEITDSQRSGELTDKGLQRHLVSALKRAQKGKQPLPILRSKAELNGNANPEQDLKHLDLSALSAPYMADDMKTLPVYPGRPACSPGPAYVNGANSVSPGLDFRGSMFLGAGAGGGGGAF